ncbi:MAG: AAA family ATPase [Ruminococcus sp.]|nr:AAA family ATPase [Ruminococcus sp.]
MNDRYIRSIKMPEFPSYDTYLSILPAVRSLFSAEELELHDKVTFFVGENGTGKSTLLEAVAVKFGFNPEGGTLNFAFSTFDTHSELHKFIKLVKGIERPSDGFFLRAESFYNAASYIEELDGIPAPSPKIIESYGGKSLHEQSHGESFFSLVMNRFSGRGLYILDEPEAALSPSRQMSLLIRINELVKNDSQFIIATHSPILLGYPDAAIYELSENGIIRTSYEETETYSVTKAFLDNPKRMMKYLFDEK